MATFTGIIFAVILLMKKPFALLALMLLIHYTKAQEVRMISADSVISVLNSRPDSGTLVVNFWATWCRPCVHELPFFSKADSSLQGDNVQFIFISFDPSSSLNQVKNFITRNGLPGTHYIIGNYDMHKFTDKVDRKWEGGIPYTAVITKESRKNKEGAFSSYLELYQFIRL